MFYLPTVILLIAAIAFVAINRRISKRVLIVVLGITVLINLLLVIAPFFAYGLHSQNPEIVRSGAFDPKGFALFNGEIGSWLHMFVLICVPLTLVVIVAFGINLSFWLARNWSQIRITIRFYTAGMLLLNVALLAFLFSPLGRTIITWHFD
jgi:hypothetical protein